METTIVYWGFRVVGFYRDHGKENGNYYSILGLYLDNGKENGNYYSIIGYILGAYYWDHPCTSNSKTKSYGARDD